MEISFLTPIAGVVAVSALLTLGVYIGRERQARRVRAALGLSAPSRRVPVSIAAALTLVPLLLGLAASQPVIVRADARSERTDAQAYFVLDTSRSMLASPRAGAPTRVERARAVANWLARELPEIPIGLAAFNERMLPYVFPTPDARVVEAALADSLGIARPRPPTGLTLSTRTTTLDALAAVPTANYFEPSARRRLLVVFTDGETSELEANLVRAFRRRPRVRTIFVRFWDRSERIYATGVPEPGYAPDPATRAQLERVSSLVGGHILDEGQRAELRDTAKRLLGSGPTKARRIEGHRIALMPYVTLAALIPLTYLLWRRNV